MTKLESVKREMVNNKLAINLKVLEEFKSAKKLLTTFARYKVADMERANNGMIAIGADIIEKQYNRAKQELKTIKGIADKYKVKLDYFYNIGF